MAHKLHCLLVQLRVLFPPVFQGSIVGGGFLLSVCSSVPIVMVACLQRVMGHISPASWNK